MGSSEWGIGTMMIDIDQPGSNMSMDSDPEETKKSHVTCPVAPRGKMLDPSPKPKGQRGARPASNRLNLPNLMRHPHDIC